MRMRSTRSIVGGLAVAALLGAGSSAAWAESAADIAVREAQKYSGTTITVIWEAGLQSLGPQNFSGPLWEELTGIKLEVVESQVNEMFPKMLQEHRAKTGAYDVLSVVPAWMGDMARAGALEPLDEYVDKYGYRDELQDIADVYRENQMKIGDTIYGFPDDGDVLILYYRKDIFEEMGLSVPTTWEEFYEVSKAITDKHAPDIYGAGFMRVRGLLHYFYQERARNEGCKFFDAESMKATVNGPGCVTALAGMVKGQHDDAARRRAMGCDRIARRLQCGPDRDDPVVAAGRSLVGGLRHRRYRHAVGAAVGRRRQGGLCAAARRPSAACGRILDGRFRR